MTLLSKLHNIPWNKKLELLRRTSDMTQEQAAEKCGTTQKVYWSWETGKRYPRQNSQNAIARAFGISKGEIFPQKMKNG